MKEFFETPDIYVIRFDDEDIIVTSVEAEEDIGVELPNLPLKP